MIDVICPYCGALFQVPPSRLKRSKQVFCSPSCNNRYHNPEKNKTLMTEEVKQKLRLSRKGSGEGKTYTKDHGRHEHRAVAEQILGRKLLPGEVVHHIDGNKKNNAPENIQVFPSQAEHARWHMLQRYKGGDDQCTTTQGPIRR